jgi:SPP1 gp7 family putative phage head morphogenesis protein
VSRQLVNIADRYDAELDKASQDVLKRIAAAYDVSYRAMVAKLRDALPRLQQAGSISTLVRQGAIAAEMGEALKFLNPGNEQAIEQLGYDVIQQAVDLGQQMAGDSLNYIGLQAPFTTIPIGAVRNQAERFRERLVNYSNQQASQISAVVEQGLIQGWGTRKIEGQLKTLGVSFKSNAETIARTETMSAYNGAAKSRYEQAGVAYVQWIATPAEGTCSLCYARNTKAWKTTEAPAIPAHPRCRCTYLPTASLSDIDTAFYEDYSKQGLDDLERQGLQPDNGPTYWEKKAGVTPAKPSWVPGQTVPVAPVAAKPAPVVKAYNPDTVYKTEGELIDRISKTNLLISRIGQLKSGEFTTVEGVQYSREDAIAKLKADNAIEKRNLLIMALNKLEDMDKALKSDPNSLRFAPNVLSQDDGHDWLQPKLYGIQSNVTFGKKGDAIYIDDNQGNSVPIYIPDPKQMLALVQKYQPMIKRIDAAAGTKPVNLDSQLDDLAQIHGVSRTVAKDRMNAVEHFSGPEYPGIRAGDGGRSTYYTEDGKKENTTPWHREQAKLINDYINDSPKYDGVIYRGFRQDTVDGAAYVEDIKKALKSDDGYGLRSFSSFSSNYEIAQNFAVLKDGADDPPEAFLIEVKRNTRGASIRSVSTITDEDEVMVPKATRYRYIGERVVEVPTISGGTTRVTVYEVEEF